MTNTKGTLFGYQPLAGPGEEWRTCPDFPAYEISNHGRIKGPSGLMTLRITKGYAAVGLTRDGKKYSRFVNRLVARAFLGEPDGEKDAAHGDGVRLNNHIDNLRWATKRENTDDRFIHGTVLTGEDHPRAITDQATVNAIRSAYEEHMKYREARGFVRGERGFRQALCREFDLSEHIIKDILSFRSW